MTNIYHIVYFERDKSIYIFFRGCNFACKGCILRLSPWDCHLPPSLYSKLQGRSASQTLSQAEAGFLIERLEVERAVLGGGEPTVDMELPSILRLLSDRNIYTILLTNGHNLDADMVQSLEAAGLNEVCVSIKAFTDNIHTYYTGASNQKLLENFKRLNKRRMRLRAESILIPGFIDVDEIECVARFIASLNPAIPYRIDAYIRVPGAPWPDASSESVRRAAEAARKYLENVSYLNADVPIVGGVKVIYPEVQS
ncbi:TPA: radical SAM protein [Candidatus Bathyarchaeota archaeon]|nr:radical SAM protein [Candidatus Bathyarchaeota archaeon]